MKDQYFGDVNDYRKYGLLRILAEKWLIGVCWMLTAPDGRSDGGKLAYLDRPERWRRHDPALFDALRRAVRVRGKRSVRVFERGRLLPGARYWSAMLGDDAVERAAYFDGMAERLRDCDLAFFDPDNGFEVASVPRGRRNSAKYLYIDEFERAYAAGHSVLVYQHFNRTEPRAEQVKRRAAQMREAAGGAMIAAFRTDGVVFLLAAQARHETAVDTCIDVLRSRWDGQIQCSVGPRFRRGMLRA